MRTDRVVLVIVAAGAPHGETEEAAGRDVDAVVSFVRARHRRIHEVVVPGSAAEEAEPGDRLRALGLFEEIARELRLHERVPGQVAVERVDHPVALHVGRGIALAPRTVPRQPARVVLAEAGHVQPVTPPALPVVGRGEEPLHHRLERAGRRVVHEGVDFLRGRGQAGEVEGGAADELAAVRRLQRLEPQLVERREHEAVDVRVGVRVGVGVGLAGALLPLGLGRRRAREGLERPEAAFGRRDDPPGDGQRRADLGPLRSGPDPVDEPLDFGIAQLGRIPRHLQVVALVPERRDEEALLGVAGDDRRPPRAPLENPLPRIEPEAARRPLGVAGEAASFQHRTYPVDEDAGARRQALVGAREDCAREDRGRDVLGRLPGFRRRRFRPGCAHGDPLREPFDVVRAEGIRVARHLLPLDLVAYRLDEEARGGISGDDGGPRNAALEERLPGGHEQIAPLERAVTPGAVLGQHRTHPGLEELLRRLRGGGRREQRRSQHDRKGEQPEAESHRAGLPGNLNTYLPETGTGSRTMPQDNAPEDAAL